VSLGENANGIPDECEGGGEGLMGGEGEEGFEQDSASADGTDEGVDGSPGGAEQFQAMTAKLRELGLPVQRPR
jgi:hypothetical protein